MSSPGTEVPNGVPVHAVVRDDGTAEVTLDGVVHRVVEAGPAEAGGAVTQMLVERAASAGEPVHAQIDDPDGVWRLVVHPDGAVDEAGSAPVERRNRRRATDPGGGIEAETGGRPDNGMRRRASDVPGAADAPPFAGVERRRLAGLSEDAAELALPDAPDDFGVEPLPHRNPVGTAPVDVVTPADVPADTRPRWVPEMPSTAPAPPVEELFPPTTSEPGPPVSAGAPGGTPEPRATGGIEVPTSTGSLPTLDDLLATRPAPPGGPAEHGWQAAVRRLTGGFIHPGPGRTERRHRDAVHAVQRSLDGPRTVVVVNPKGGAHKTTATLLLAATFGIHRGGYTLAWDNNETRGTLGWRSAHPRHSNTAVNLLNDLERFSDLRSARVGDLDNYVRSQGSAQFDVLASDEDAASAASIDAAAFTALHRTLARFYRVMVVDTGNNMRASNWQAAVAAADQLVIVATVREDTAQSAAWAIDALRATGHEDAVAKAVTVLSAPAVDVDTKLRARLHDHFGQLTRAVLDVPYDPSLVAGGPLVIDALSASTREAWLHVTATVADGL